MLFHRPARGAAQGVLHVRWPNDEVAAGVDEHTLAHMFVQNHKLACAAHGVCRCRGSSVGQES